MVQRATRLDWGKLLCAERRRDSKVTAADGRSEFERDYDRTVFSTPVRRLQDKTQVFPLEPNDAVRTRLTHSLEVSTLARGLARSTAVWLRSKGEVDADQERHIESIAATCGLIHDLGNPPFGHAGEQAISTWFKKRLSSNSDGSFFPTVDQPLRKQLDQDFLNFEGNAQMLRIVARLQLLADQYGLNLTYGTLSAAMKYTAASNEVSNEAPHEKSKPGYFASEQYVVDDIRKKIGISDSRNPIAYLVEACDDMVYATVDLEDGVKKGVIGWQEVKRALRQALAQAIEESSSQCTSIAPADATVMLRDHLKRTSGYFAKAEQALQGNARDSALAQHFRTLVIGTTKVAVLKAFIDHYDEIMHGTYHGELIESSTAAPLINACKSVGRAHVYSSDETLRLETLGRRVIHDLMDFFWEGASAYKRNGKAPKNKNFDGKIYRLLSQNYRTVFESSLLSSSLPDTYHQFQLVTDYVCGMTDSFACNLHSQLTHG